MATKKVSELTALTSPDGAEELLINDGGTSKKITQANLLLGIDNTSADATAITIDSSENVGIGTTSPSVRLDVDAGTTAVIAQLTTDSSDAAVLKITNEDGTDQTWGVAVAGSTHATGNDSFYIRDESRSLNRLIIDSSGNVGIGTDDPSAVWSSASNLVIKDTSSDGGMTILSGTSGNGNIMFSDTATAAYADARGLITYLHASDDMRFITANTEAMRIDSSGNVGFGVTPESWSSAYSALQIGGNASISGYKTQQAGNVLHLLQNAYDDGTSKYITTDEASNYYQLAGKHIFRVAPSGTADSAISWTTAITIENDGKVNVAGGSATAGISMYQVTGIGQLKIGKTYSGATSAVIFKYNDTSVGSIGYTDSSTSYNTSSDYRLKENVVPMTGSIDRLKELNPSRFNFIADDSVTVDGFLAHEAQEVVPEAITGTKDGMQTEEYTVSEALGEVFTPAVEEVTEERQVTPAVEAQDAVMSERQVTETVETGSYVNLAGETITETSEVGVTEEATETVVERQTGEDGITREVEVERTVNVPVMETYEESPAIEAVAEVTETVVTTEAVAEVILETDVEKPEELTEGQWRETTTKVTAEREVPDMQGIDQGKLVPLLVGALQEAIARIEELENT